MDKATRAKGKIFEAAARGWNIYVCRSTSHKACIAMLMYMGPNEFQTADCGIAVFRFRIKKWMKLSKRQWEQSDYTVPASTAPASYKNIISALREFDYAIVTPHEAMRIVDHYQRYL